ncbi:IS630 family transposase [Caenispirillum salinarum]|uniref:IS630 family transposase n=1 Tax=Caenispirillum salinarum TaxID=859058 RepID=UPI00384FF587
MGSAIKKTLRATETQRPDVKSARDVWIARRQPFMRTFLEKLVFIDETGLKTNMTKRTGWAPCGDRLVSFAPFGHWRSQTFIAALRHDGLVAPWVINGAMNRRLFECYIGTQLAPMLKPGDVVILDNLSSHKSPQAARALRDVGAWLLFLPPYSPDLNPIEMVFSKLKTLIRKAAARSYETLWAAVGHICDLVSEDECRNFLKAAGYEGD